MRSQLKRALHWLLTTVWLREGTTRRVLFGPYRGLSFQISAPMHTRPTVFYRAYEPDVTGWLISHVQPGMTVYIVGAHAGIHALMTARLLQGQGHVYAFEGWPENHQALQTNIALNHHLGVVIEAVPVCISDTFGQTTMAQGTADGKHHLADDNDQPATTITVPATTLDDFVSEKQTHPDLIVIDIEGHELAALRGGQKLIQAHRPVLLLEHHDQGEALAVWLDVQGYTIEKLGRRHLIATPG